MSRAGSHTPSESPMRGIGEPQRQIGEEGFARSGAPETPPMVIGPMEIGNRHSQQTSEMGFTNRPVHTCAEAVPAGSRAHSANASRATPRHLMAWPPIRPRMLRGIRPQEGFR